MNSNLTVIDPLSEQEVTIIITLLPSQQPRDQRAALISVGVAAQLPVIKTGTFAEVTDLVDEAWQVFAVRAQLAEADEEDENLIEAQVVASVATESDESEPIPQPNSSTPKPQAKNLSLF